MKNEQIKSELVSLIRKELIGQDYSEPDMFLSSKTFVQDLADKIIVLFDKSGKSGKTNTCQCEDSQYSYMETDSNNKTTRRLICGECDKPYDANLRNTTNEVIEFSGKKILDWDIKDSNVSEFWYWNKLGKEFKVKSCSYKGQIAEMGGISKYDIPDIYLVNEGEFRGNAILKKHCKNM